MTSIFCIFAALYAQILMPILVGGAASPATAFVTSATGGTDRNDFGGNVGFRFVPASNLTITALGRFCVSGNAQTHVLALADAVPRTIVASVTVDMTGCTPGAFVYGTVSVGITSGTTYVLSSAETVSGDNWKNEDVAVTTTAAGTIGASVYNTGSAGGPYIDSAVGVKAFVPTNFKY